MKEIEVKFKKLRKELSGIGPICTGSISVVYTRCGNDYCPCKYDETKRHGPYNLWTRKIKGKTISMRLSKNQVKLFKEASKNLHKMRNIIEKIKDLSAKIIEKAK